MLLAELPPASMHIGSGPGVVGLPGMQPKPFVPTRSVRIATWPMPADLFHYRAAVLQETFGDRSLADIANLRGHDSGPITGS
jgi:hypothetical protein